MHGLVGLQFLVTYQKKGGVCDCSIFGFRKCVQEVSSQEYTCICHWLGPWWATESKCQVSSQKRQEIYTHIQTQLPPKMVWFFPEILTEFRISMPPYDAIKY